MENSGFLQMQPAQAFADQDHDAQLIFGIGYKLENPEYQEKVSEFMKLKYPEVVL